MPTNPTPATDHADRYVTQYLRNVTDAAGEAHGAISAAVLAVAYELWALRVELANLRDQLRPPAPPALVDVELPDPDEPADD